MVERDSRIAILLRTPRRGIFGDDILDIARGRLRAAATAIETSLIEGIWHDGVLISGFRERSEDMRLSDDERYVEMIFAVSLDAA